MYKHSNPPISSPLLPLPPFCPVLPAHPTRPVPPVPPALAVLIVLPILPHHEPTPEPRSAYETCHRRRHNPVDQTCSGG